MGGYFDFLRRVYFFRDVNDEELRLIEAQCHEEHFSPGDILFVEGAKADRFFIVLNGKVEVWKNYYDSQPDLLAVHGPGHFFGEMALIDDLPRSATVVAREETRLVSMYRDEFHSLVQRHAPIALSVMRSVSFMVRNSNETYVDDLRKRYTELEVANRELERAQAERLLGERLSTLGKFSSLILHDIRNPISVLKGQLHLMEINIGETEKLRHNIRNATIELERMEALACEFLDYIRGDIRLDMTVTTARALVDKAVSAVSDQFRQNGMEIVADDVTDVPVILDAARIHRVLVNVADNARKAMEKGGRLVISTRIEEERLVFQLEDNGEGMSAETRERLFEPFYSMSKKGGTGLGMLIVKNIIESHGGSIRIDSERGRGTSVRLMIPYRG